jgi:polyphosphate kinase
MVKLGGDEESLLGDYTPKELHREIERIVIEQSKKYQQIYEDILAQMATENMFVVNEKQLTSDQGEEVLSYFNNKVLPSMVPLMLTQTAKFPDLRDRSVYLAVKLSKSNAPEEFTYSLVRIPGKSLPRFLVLPEKDGKKYVIFLDDVIRYCLKELYPIFDYDTLEAYAFKISRDAELDIDDDISKSFVEKMSAGLKKRKKGSTVRMVYDREMPEDLLEYITKKLKVGKTENQIASERYHNRKDLMDFPNIGEPHHYYQRIRPLQHKDLPARQSVLKQIAKRDILLHFPYQSYNHVIDFLREAAIDPNVKEIGLTVYRVATFSKVMNALQNAARNGKKVTVLIELQARFDEENNIFWSNKLQEEGVNVIHGVPGLKVHSKIAYVAREEEGEKRYYAYIGTGNFHEGTARVYADEGLMTADPRIATEVANIFEFFRLNYRSFDYEHLIVSPFHLRNFFTAQIENEIRLAKEEKDAYMIIKLNSLVDKSMVKMLYKASAAGVKIKLIVRGVCSIVPGVHGLSENIEIISIVDKFLEHSRILLFGNGGEEQIFIASADWMPRNLNRRIEVACPIYDEELKVELKEQLLIQLQDNQKARILDRDLRNSYCSLNKNEPIRSQIAYYNYLREIHKSEKRNG